MAREPARGPYGMDYFSGGSQIMSQSSQAHPVKSSSSRDKTCTCMKLCRWCPFQRNVTALQMARRGEQAGVADRSSQRGSARFWKSGPFCRQERVPERLSRGKGRWSYLFFRKILSAEL